nr:MAG TPA: hypothetical protein [Caudoviricetes sp.]DAW76626.1 MAG TPA: hypothetical protein [Caudoviricetes sp.]
MLFVLLKQLTSNVSVAILTINRIQLLNGIQN